MEEIDIGGVTLLRAAAKNHARVCVLSDPRDYAEFLQQLDKGAVTDRSRQLYALKAFEQTAEFDSMIADFFRRKYASDSTSSRQHLSLRYGAVCISKTHLSFSYMTLSLDTCLGRIYLLYVFQGSLSPPENWC